MTSFRLSLVSVASVCLLLSACAGGSGGGTGGATGAAGTGSGTAGAGGQSGTSGAAGSGGTTGDAGTGGGVAGVAGTGAAGTTGSAGQSGSAGTTGSAGSGGRGGTGGTAGTTGVAGQGGSAGATGAAGSSAGRGGTGGQAGSAAGAGGRGGTTGSAGTGGATATGFFSDGFESGTIGHAAGGLEQLHRLHRERREPQRTRRSRWSTARARTPAPSRCKVHGGQQPAQLTRPLPTGTNKLYARAWIWFTRQLGMNPGANHETLLGIRKAVGSANDEVRFGEIKGVIGTNEVPSDNISPKMAQWGMGPVVAPNGWRCIEVAFLADQAQHTLTAWADGVMVHAITAPDQWQNGNLPANWMNGKFVEFIMGWQSFSGVDTDLWIDDVVLSNSPIGCN